MRKPLPKNHCERFPQYVVTLMRYCFVDKLRSVLVHSVESKSSPCGGSATLILPLHNHWKKGVTASRLLRKRPPWAGNVGDESTVPDTSQYSMTACSARNCSNRFFACNPANYWTFRPVRCTATSAAYGNELSQTTEILLARMDLSIIVRLTNRPPSSISSIVHAQPMEM